MKVNYSPSGDIFTANLDALVNPVNTVGVMGKGLALEFKKQYPKNYEIYRQQCASGQAFFGGDVMDWSENGVTILNVATKEHWRDPSQLSFIEKGLKNIKRKCTNFGLKKLGMPKIGCGLGGLSWQEVCPMILSTFEDMPDDFELTLFGEEL